MKIDLHVHSSERSGCGRSSEEEMIRAACGFGLDGFVFTDHGRLVPAERLRELNAKHEPFRIFGGIEINVLEGEDVLVLGAADPALEERGWSYPELVSCVRERGGFIAVAHPLRFRDELLIDAEGFPPDAFELRSKNLPAAMGEKIREVARRAGARLLCNSDAHEAGHVGIYYNDLERLPADEKDLVAILKAGAYECRADASRAEARDIVTGV